jgi:hypothetical protein
VATRSIFHISVADDTTIACENAPKPALNRTSGMAANYNKQHKSRGSCQTQQPSFVTELPVEIVQNIFLVYVRTEKNGFKDLTLLSSICGYWREIAISYQSLWSRIRDQHPEIFRTQLIRSGGSFLDIDLMFKNNISPQFLQLLSQVATRICTFAASVSCYELGTVFKIFKTANHLNSIDLAVWDDMGDYYSEIITLDSSKLQAIKLRDVYLPSTTQLPINLRELQLVGSDIFCVNIKFLANILLRLSRLEILRLECAVEVPKDWSATPAIHMPNLEYLYLQSNFLDIESLLGAFHVSPSTVIAILVSSLELADNMFMAGQRVSRALMPWYARRLLHSPPNSLALWILDNPIGEFWIEIYEGTEDVLRIGLQDHQLLPLFELKPWFDGLESLLTASSKICELSIDIHGDIPGGDDTDILSALLPYCRHISECIITRFSGNQFAILRALAALDFGICAPCLREISIEGINVDSDSPSDFINVFRGKKTLETITFMRGNGLPWEGGNFQSAIEAEAVDIDVIWDD